MKSLVVGGGDKIQDCFSVRIQCESHNWLPNNLWCHKSCLQAHLQRVQRIFTISEINIKAALQCQGHYSTHDERTVVKLSTRKRSCPVSKSTCWTVFWGCTDYIDDMEQLVQNPATVWTHNSLLQAQLLAPTTLYALTSTNVLTYC